MEAIMEVSGAVVEVTYAGGFDADGKGSEQST